MGTRTNQMIQRMQGAIADFEEAFSKLKQQMERGDSEAAYQQVGAARGALVEKLDVESSRLERQAKTVRNFRPKFDRLRTPLDRSLRELKKFKEEKEKRAMAKIVETKESFQKIDEYIEKIEHAMKECENAVSKFAEGSRERAALSRDLKKSFGSASDAGKRAQRASRRTDD